MVLSLSAGYTLFVLTLTGSKGQKGFQIYEGKCYSKILLQATLSSKQRGKANTVPA